MNEAGFWQVVRRNLSPFGVLRRIENRLDLGTPDVSYCLRLPQVNAHAQETGFMFDAQSGWIELKRVERWANGNLVIPHLTIDQVINLEQWSKAGGRAWLLAAVNQDVVLLHAAHVRTIYKDRPPRQDVLGMAHVYGHLREFPTREILEALTK